jgi:hypothetical protein
VLFWIFIVAGAILMLIEIGVAMVPEKYFVLSDFYKGNLTFGISGLFEYDFATRLGQDLIFKPALLVLLPTLVLNLVFYIINFKQVQAILKTIIVDRPFAEENARSLFVMSVTFIVGSFVLNLASNLDFIKILSMLGVGGINFDFTPNFSMLFTGILLIILSGVFRYGNYLQDEYDSTI